MFVFDERTLAADADGGVVWCGVNITDLSPLSLRAHASNLDWTKIILIIGVGGQGFDWAAIIVCDDN